MARKEDENIEDDGHVGDLHDGQEDLEGDPVVGTVLYHQLLHLTLRWVLQGATVQASSPQVQGCNSSRMCNGASVQSCKGAM